VPLFRRLRVNRVVTSPSLRCSPTVRPLALDRGLAVELSDALAEGAATTDALSLLESSPDGSVLCTHGDILVAVIGRLTADGMRLDGSAGWKVGSTWVLERRLGRFSSARYVAPPQFH
jgi:phosphohistidine phosphatase SixA